MFHCGCPLLSGDEDHILLNQGTGQLSLGSEPLDYETGPRLFSLTVRAVDNPDGSLHLYVSHTQFTSFSIENMVD